MMTEYDYNVCYLCSDRTHVHWAVVRDDCELLKILLQNGEDPNIQDGEGNSPLHYLLSQDLEIVETLVNHGANVDFKNEYDRTPLHTLVSNYDPCIKDARLKSVKMLLEKGANVNSQDDTGSTPLHVLAQCVIDIYWHPSDDDICDLLLGYGANLQLQDVDGCTPLHIAARRHSLSTAKLLESTFGKSAVNITNKSGEYPLHTAVRHVNLEGSKLLLDNGSSINCTNGNGQTALHFTSIYFPIIYDFRKDLVVFLLQRGAEVNCQDGDGRTSLDHAAKLCVEFNVWIDYFDLPSLHEHINILLDWGALFGSEDASWKSRIDSSPFFEDQMKYEIRKTCLDLRLNVTKQVSSVQEFQNYEKNCCKEVKRMKSERHGNISLYDIFHQQFDPYFLSNKGLILTLRSTHLEEHYPIYASLLTATYHRSKERVKLFDSVSTILQIPLPLEMIRYIMTFVDNESLRNVIKAKELL